MRGRDGWIAWLLVVALGGTARSQSAPPAEAAAKELVKKGGSALARRDLDEAAHDFGEAVKLAPTDARLREKWRHALERRARACEARAAHPPPPPLGFSDAPRDPGLVPLFKDRRWKARLRREAFEARADAEAARAMPDEKKLAKLRGDVAAEKAEENRLTAAIADEEKKDEDDEAEQQKAFESIHRGGVGH